MPTRRVEELHLRYRRDLEAELRRKPQQLMQTIQAAADCLVAAVESRDPNMPGHAQRVQRYALALGRSIGLTSAQLFDLGLAAYLHDVGKIGIPDAILCKEGRLTPDERAAINMHPELGERILRPLLSNESVLAIVRHHHERIDGQGYPDGLEGTEIPLGSRIIAVVDTFDALTSSRCYRPAVPLEHAEAVLLQAAGTQLQTNLVATFLDMLGSEPELREIVPAPSAVGAQFLHLRRAMEGVVRKVS
jgi:HD-GYP domain-containing protein (c-di-GMP phosphodiesterase class II)